MSVNNLPRFIVNTEYATLKNFPATITVTVNIIGGGSLPAGNYSNNQTIATPLNITIPKGAPLQSDISVSINSDIRWQGDFLQFVENSGTGSQYDGMVLVTMSGENEISVNASLFNPQVGAVTVVSRTIVVRIRSFEPPFS